MQSQQRGSESNTRGTISKCGAKGGIRNVDARQRCHNLAASFNGGSKLLGLLSTCSVLFHPSFHHMAHYDIFRDLLATKYPAYGHALWEPSPGRLYSAVEVGDVGFVRQFRRLFNALLPADHPSHRNFGVPTSYEPLAIPRVAEHIDSLPLDSQDFCSGGVMRTPESEVFAAA